MTSIHLAIDVVGVKHSGGATVLLDLLAKILSDQRIEKITLFCSPRVSRNFDLPTSSKIIEVEEPRAEQSYLYRLWWHEHALGEACVRKGADVLLCMTGMGRSKPPTPHITYIQQSLPFSKEALSRCGRSQRYRMMLMKKLMHRSCLQSAKVVVQTRTMRQWVSEGFGIDRHHIKAILPFPQLLPTKKQENPGIAQVRAIPDERRLLYVGNLDAYKNLEVVTQGMKTIRSELPDATLFLTCPPDHPLCLQESIVGLGYLDKSALREAYELATVLVHPSLVESATLPLLEAMLLGTPILAADRPYAHDECDSAAVFFHPHHSKDFASKAIDLLKNEAKRHELIRKGTYRIDYIRESDPYSQLLDVLVQVATKTKKT